MYQSKEVNLKLALTYYQKVVDMLEQLNAQRHVHFDHTSTKSVSNCPPDILSSQRYLVSRARDYLSELDNDTEFQTFITTSKPTFLSLFYSLELRIHPNSTSGVSYVESISINGEPTSEEIDGLKQSCRLVLTYQK